LMSEAAALERPGAEVVEIRGQRLLNGVVLDGDSASVQVSARRCDEPAGQRTAGRYRFETAISSLDGQGRTHYQAQITLANLVARMNTPEFQVPALHDAGAFPMSIDEAYQNWLFHGPAFQRIVSIDALGPSGATALVLDPHPAGFFDVPDRGYWLNDPVLLDCAFQVQLLWARRYWDISSLPTSVARQRWFSRPAVSDDGRATERLIRVEMRMRAESSNPISRANYVFFAEDGTLLGVVEDAQLTGSLALNRLIEQQHRMTSRHRGE
jgi:hypothetical protein